KEAADKLEQLTKRLERPLEQAAEPASSDADAMAFDVTEGASPPEVTQRPAPTPGPARAPPRNAVPNKNGLPDDRVKAIFDAYVSAKRRCKESTQGITYDALASTLRKQMPVLLLK